MNGLKTISHVIIFLFISSIVLAQDGNNNNNFQDTNFFNNPDLNNVNKVELFPNPTINYLFVEIQNSNLVQVQFEMHSIIGTKIEVVPEELSSNKFRISVEELNPGYYFLVINDTGTRFNQAFKFVKR